MKVNDNESSQLEFEMDKENVEPNQNTNQSWHLVPDLERQVANLTSQLESMKSKNEACVERLRVSDSKVKVLQDELTKQRWEAVEEKTWL